jgi:hypothetical protein
MCDVQCQVINQGLRELAVNLNVSVKRSDQRTSPLSTLRLLNSKVHSQLTDARRRVG